MKRISTLAIALTIALLSAGAASADSARDEFDQTFAFAAGSELTLRNTNGDVFIEAWDRDELQVRAVKRVKTRGSSAEEALEELRIEIDVDGNGVEIDTIYPSWKRLFGWSGVSASVEYDVKIPKRADLRIRTVNGEVEIAGVHGEIELSSTNGGLNVSESSGSVSASTTNGGIQVELSEVSGSGMEFDTTNGGIRLHLPRSVQASISARTTNGSIETDFPISVSGTFRRNRLSGDINGGGPTIEMRTTNGSIRIRDL